MRWSTGQCNTTLWQWNCLSKQSLLQLYSVVSNSSFKNVRLLATILCYCGFWNGIKQDQWWKSKPQGHPLLARTPDNVEQVRDTMLWSLHRSVWQQALALCLNKCSIWWILHKDLHYHPYKIPVAQEHSEWDKVSQHQFCSILGLGAKQQRQSEHTTVRQGSLLARV